MKFILKLLKEILNRVSNLYSNESVDELLSAKVSKEDSDGAIEGLAKSRKDKDDTVQGLIDSNKAYDEALTNVIKWQSYAASMQSMVDEDTAIQIAEEFEKATVEYLKDPTATKKWDTKNIDGQAVSTNPYYNLQPDKPIVDFAVVSAYGESYYNYSSFGNAITDAVVFLPNATNCESMFRGTNFAGIIFCPSAKNCYRLFQLSASFNQPLSFPLATNCSAVLNGATSFNSSLYLPKATNCAALLQGATSFNQPLSLPSATNCSYMLSGATSFNQPLSLPKATTGTNLLQNATSFNSSIDFPVMVSCNGLLYKAKSFNQSFTLPNARDCHTLCQEASSLDQPVYLPACRGASNAFLLSGMSAKNITITLDSLPTWNDDASHSISFAKSPGSKYVDTHEPIMVEVNGEYHFFDDFPRYTTDDINDTLRKSTASAVARGWTIEMGDPEGEDWKTYMLSKAELTGVQSNIDLVNQAISEYGADNAALLPNRMIKDWDAIYVGYETYVASCGEESQLGSDFWVEYFAALVRYFDNPTETKNWDNYKDDDGTLLSRCPYFDAPPTVPVVDFAVTSCNGTVNTRSAFSRTGTNVPIYLPCLTTGSFILSNCDEFNSPLILPEAKTLVQAVYSCAIFNSVLYAPKVTSFPYAFHIAAAFNRPIFFTKATNCAYLLSQSGSFSSPVYLPKAVSCTRLLSGTKFNHPLVLPSATDCSYMLRYALAFNNVVDIPKATNCSYMLDGATLFNQHVSLPACSNALSAFSNTALDSNNISSILDSLPTWADGVDHVITFTGSPGASELTQDSPSVASAVAKGWTVEL